MKIISVIVTITICCSIQYVQSQIYEDTTWSVLNIEDFESKKVKSFKQIKLKTIVGRNFGALYWINGEWKSKRVNKDKWPLLPDNFPRTKMIYLGIASSYRWDDHLSDSKDTLVSFTPEYVCFKLKNKTEMGDTLRIRFAVCGLVPNSKPVILIGKKPKLSKLTVVKICALQSSKLSWEYISVNIVITKKTVGSRWIAIHPNGDYGAIGILPPSATKLLEKNSSYSY